MAKTLIEKVVAVFEGLSAGDADLATKYLNKDRFLQHNPYAADGVDGLRKFMGQSSREHLHFSVVRAFQDGEYVVIQLKGQRSGKGVLFDVFRFEDGLVVEHWAFSAMEAPPNKSGHTQLDGPREARDLESTEKNKSFMRKYYETFHIAGDHSHVDEYFKGDLCVRHEPGVRDGVSEFKRDVAVLMQHRTIDEVVLLLGQGDFVFTAAKGTHKGEPCVYVDLYRVEDEKIVEHWGFPEKVPPQSECKNSNGLL